MLGLVARKNMTSKFSAKSIMRFRHIASTRSSRVRMMSPILMTTTTFATTACVSMTYPKVSCESSSSSDETRKIETGVIKYMIKEDSQNTFVYNLYVPLVYAAVFPLVRIIGRGRVPVQTINKVQLGLVFAALMHAGYIMGSDSSM